MKKEGLAFFTDVEWTVTGLVIFFALFVMIMTFQYLIFRKDDVKKFEQLPFEGDLP